MEGLPDGADELFVLVITVDDGLDLLPVAFAARNNNIQKVGKYN